MADTTEKTVASELCEAAARLRKARDAASPAPWKRDGMSVATRIGTAARAYTSVDVDWIALASPALAEPLASWLESAAQVAQEHPQDPDYAGRPDTRFCTTCQDEETTCVSFVAGALAVVEAFNRASP